MGKYNGFASYLTTGTFTDEFIKDYKYWCKRIYGQWKGLQMEFDTFYETCWEALLTKINQFDPNRATIQTFCINTKVTHTQCFKKQTHCVQIFYKVIWTKPQAGRCN